MQKVTVEFELSDESMRELQYAVRATDQSVEGFVREATLDYIGHGSKCSSREGGRFLSYQDVETASWACERMAKRLADSTHQSDIDARESFAKLAERLSQ